MHATILHFVVLLSAASVTLSTAQQHHEQHREAPTLSLRGTNRKLNASVRSRCRTECLFPFDLGIQRRCVDSCIQRNTPPPPPPTAAPTPAATLLSNTFSIINPISGRALEVDSGGDCENGSVLQLRSTSTSPNSRPTQRFYFGPDNSIISVGCVNKAITRSSDCESASAITISTFTGGPHQQWDMEGEHITSSAPNCRLVLDIFGAQTVDGAEIILYQQNGQENQYWMLEV